MMRGPASTTKSSGIIVSSGRKSASTVHLVARKSLMPVPPGDSRRMRWSTRIYALMNRVLQDPLAQMLLRNLGMSFTSNVRIGGQSHLRRCHLPRQPRHRCVVARTPATRTPAVQWQFHQWGTFHQRRCRPHRRHILTVIHWGRTPHLQWERKSSLIRHPRQRRLWFL